jgi:formimidoylglutamate deiminase
VAAAPEAGRPSSAERLFERAVDAGAAAAGEPAWGLVAGARADALVVDRADQALLGLGTTRLLDGLVFSSPSSPWHDVMVAGRWVVSAHRHPGADAIADRFVATMAELWPDSDR